MTEDSLLGHAPCDCRACPTGCRWSISIGWPWTTCKACRKGRHRTHGS